MPAASLAALIGFGATGAQAQMAMPCPEPQGHYAECLQGARNAMDRRDCAAMVQHELQEIDVWLDCQALNLEQRHAKERAGLLALANQKRARLGARLTQGSTSLR